MKNMKRWKLLSALLTLAVLVPGCVGKKNARTISELKAPEASFITASLSEVKDARLVILNDGTVRVMTEEDETPLDLMQWEYYLTEDYFTKKKTDLQEKGATATHPEWHEGDPYPGTQINYNEYDDVDYKEYVEDSHAMWAYKEYFDDNYKLKERPDVRVEVVMYYMGRIWPDDGEDFTPDLPVDDDEIGRCYQRGFEMALEDPDMREALLSSVNADSFTSGKEAWKLEIAIDDYYDQIRIHVSVYPLDFGIGDKYGMDKVEEWKIGG